jgi:iron complex outermembrane receptor protein
MAATAPSFAQSSTAGGIPEVVVTAQKREESLTETPVAISAFTAEQRDLVGITSTADMTNFTPGFIYNSGQDRVSMRGIGRYTNQLGADSSVGVYEDGAFETFTTRAGNSTLFVDRVEVLRGPQGTLYGRNSIGGAINIISRRPTKEFYAEARLSYDNYHQAIKEAAMSGPISDNVQYRVAAMKLDQTRGYFKNVGGGPDSGGVRDEWYAEGQLEMQLGDNDTLWLKIFGGEWTNGGGNAGGRTSNSVIVGLDGKTKTPDGRYPANYIPTSTTLLFNETTNPLVPSLGVAYLAPVRDTYNPTGVNPGNNNIREFYSVYPQYVHLRDYYGAVLQYNHSFENVDLKYIGSAQHYNYYEGVEWGEGFILATGDISYQMPGQARVFPDSILLYGENHTFSTNEINLISTHDGALQWVFGVYNFNEHYSQPEDIALPGQAQLETPLALGTFTPTPRNPTRAVLDWDAVAGAKTLAAYGQIDWSFTEAWKTTLGLRYSKDWKWGWDSARTLLFNPQAGIAIDLTAATLSPLAYPGATSPWMTANGQAMRRLEGDWDGVTGTAGIQWSPDDSRNLYFKFSRGYKSGGFNIGSGLVANPQTDPEHSNDFQLGYKQNVGNSFQFNLALFFDQYFDAQIPIGVVSNAGVITTQFYNMPESETSGLEIESIWQATDALQFIFSYGYNKTEIVESGCVVNAAGDPTASLVGAKPAGCTNGGQNLEGNQLPNAPENKAALNGNYTLDLGGSALTLSASYIWRDKQYGSVFNTPYTEAPSWDQVDVRATLKTYEDKLTIIGSVKNVFDDIGYSIGAQGVVQRNVIPTSATTFTSVPVGFVKNFPLTAPRIFALELQYKF